MKAIKNTTLPSYDQKISTLFQILFLTLFVAITAAIYFYPEPFLFWQHAFSNLGDRVSLAGYNNMISRIIYISGIVTASIVLFQISAHYKQPFKFQHQAIKQRLAAFSGTGFLISTPPNNLYPKIHSLGMTIAVGSLYLIIMYLLFEQRAQIPAWLFYIDIIILQVVLFSYAVGLIVCSIFKQTLQKLCFISMTSFLLRATSLTQENPAPDKILASSKRLPH